MSFQQNNSNVTLTNIVYFLEKLGFTANFQDVNVELGQVSGKFQGNNFTVTSFEDGVKICPLNSRFYLTMTREEFLQEEALDLIKFFLNHKITCDLPLEEKEYEIILIKNDCLHYSFTLIFFDKVIKLDVPVFDDEGFNSEINLTNQIRNKVLEVITFFIPENCVEIDRNVATNQIQMTFVTSNNIQFTLKFGEHFLKSNFLSLLPEADNRHGLNQTKINEIYGSSSGKNDSFELFFESVCEEVNVNHIFEEKKEDLEEEEFIFDNIIVRKDDDEINEEEDKQFSSNDEMEEFVLSLCQDLLSIISLRKFSNEFMITITDEKYVKNPELIKEIKLPNSDDNEILGRLSLLYECNEKVYIDFYSEIIVLLQKLTNILRQ